VPARPLGAEGTVTSKKKIPFGLLLLERFIAAIAHADYYRQRDQTPPAFQVRIGHETTIAVGFKGVNGRPALAPGAS
jgi:hypothetical protein